MKKLILVAAILAFISTSQAQVINTVNVKDIYVMKTGDKSRGIGFGDKASTLVAIAGNPDKIYDYKFEMDDKIAKVYQYGLNLFYFADDRLAIYDLYDGKFSVGTVNGTVYKVGDKLTVTSKVIPIDPRIPSRTRTEITKSFLNFKLTTTPGKTRDIPYETIMYGVIGTADATSFEIVFNKDNSIINIHSDGGY